MSAVLLDDVILSEDETAALIDESACQLREARYRGVGPPFAQIGRSVCYLRSSVLRWREQHARMTLSELLRRKQRRRRRCKHGHTRNGKNSPTYESWSAMRLRCQNPNHVGWKRYGGRGIKVCSRWQSFVNFLADMGKRPRGKTIHRLDNDKHYEPGNCVWATAEEQAAAKRKAVAQ